MSTLSLKKLDSPFVAEKDKMNDLAFRIQSAAGLNPQEIFPRQQTPVIESRVSPVQLSVEFGVTSRSIEAPVRREEKTEFIEETTPSDAVSDAYQVEVKPNVAEDKPELEVKQTQTTSVDLIDVESSEVQEKDKTVEIDVPSPAIPDKVEVPTNAENQQEVVESSTIQIKERENLHKVNTRQEQTVSRDNTQPSFQIPWASLLGLVATAVAVFGAYWVWMNIQKPASVEDVVHNVSNQTRVIEQQPRIEPVVSSPAPKQPELVELTQEQELLSSLLERKSYTQLGYLDFVASDEPSKVSMVELEKKGFIVLELEDDLFEPIRL